MVIHAECNRAQYHAFWPGVDPEPAVLARGPFIVVSILYQHGIGSVGTRGLSAQNYLEGGSDTCEQNNGNSVQQTQRARRE
jgi:hypothetical protein